MISKWQPEHSKGDLRALNRLPEFHFKLRQLGKERRMEAWEMHTTVEHKDRKGAYTFYRNGKKKEYKPKCLRYTKCTQRNILGRELEEDVLCPTPEPNSDHCKGGCNL